MPETTRESEARAITAARWAREARRREFASARCSLCGSARLAMDDGTAGACSFVCCTDPTHDLDNGG